MGKEIDQMVIIWVLLVSWTHYVMPLMGFNSRTEK